MKVEKTPKKTLALLICAVIAVICTPSLSYTYAAEPAYVTIYEDSAGTVVLTKDQVPKDSTYTISRKVTAPKSGLVFAGWSTSPGRDGDDREVVSETTFTVSSNIKLYPVFRAAHWITFVTAPAGSGATYIAPKSVGAGSTAASAEPEVEIRYKGHEFEGWSETPDADYDSAGSFTPFDFDRELKEDVTLYAQWKPGHGTYTVIYWKQNISDSRDAADDAKTYTFASQETMNAAVGSRVGYPDADPDEGFVFNTDKSDSDVTVNADGTSIVNVYFDRRLITLKFYRYGSSARMPGYSSSYYDTETGNDRVKVYKGLYGQTLVHNGYNWPSDGMYFYYYGNGKSIRGMSYLGQFVLPPELSGSSEMRLFYNGDAAVKTEFYLQHADGSYPDSPSDMGVGPGGNLILSDKYDGYEVVQYRRYTGDHDWVDSDWTDGPADTELIMKSEDEVPVYYDAAVRYRLRSYNLKYLDPVDNTELPGIDTATIRFTDSMSDYVPSSSFIPVPQYPGKVWDGKWYKDRACTEEFVWSDTMPNADVNVYAGWDDVYYRVKIDPDSTVIPDGSIQLRVKYGETVGQYLADRDHVETPDGAYTLMGWYDITDGTAKPYNFETEVTGDLALRAEWRKSGVYRVKYETGAVDKAGKPIDGAKTSDNPADADLYADKASSAIEGAPLPPDKYIFIGWCYGERVCKPGDVFTIDADLADKNNTIRLYPVLDRSDIAENGNGDNGGEAVGGIKDTGGKRGRGPYTGDKGFGLSLVLLSGSAAAFILMLAGRRREQK